MTGNPHQKVYARGYFDGMRAAGVNTVGMIIERAAMNEAKFNSIYNGLSSVAKKVYQSVPISSIWSAAQIHRELLRTGCAGDMKVTAGCLNTLLSSSLILEPRKGEFQRVAVRKKSDSSAEKMDEQGTGLKALSAIIENSRKVDSKEIKMPPKTEQSPKDPIDKLSLLSAKALQISESLKTLANDIDNAALEISEQMSSSDAETTKLRQLQQLLKSLG